MHKLHHAQSPQKSYNMAIVHVGMQTYLFVERNKGIVIPVRRNRYYLYLAWKK
jgi:hypothetical protein